MSSSSSSHTILALKGEGFAILAGLKTCSVYQNIYYGASGDSSCCENLEQSLINAEFPKVKSVRSAASYITNHINNTYSSIWAEEKVGLEILLVGNIIRSNQFHIFRISKKVGAAGEYERVEIQEQTAVIGGCDAEMMEMLGNFRQNTTLKEADLLAFKVIRKSIVGVDLGIRIRIISISRKDAVTSVLHQDCNSEYGARSDTRVRTNDRRGIRCHRSVIYKVKLEN